MKSYFKEKEGVENINGEFARSFLRFAENSILRNR